MDVNAKTVSLNFFLWVKRQGVMSYKINFYLQKERTWKCKKTRQKQKTNKQIKRTPSG